MKRKLFFLLVLVAALLGGCTSHNTTYKVYEMDGIWYLEFDPAKMAELSHLSIETEYQQFQSVPQMVKKIKNGKLTDDQLFILHSRAENNVLELFDLDNAPDLVFPSDLQLEYIRWAQGYRYAFIFKYGRGLFYFTDQSGYDSFYNRVFLETEEEKCDISSDRQIRDRNAREICYDVYGTKFKCLLYDLPRKDFTLHVKELYTLSSKNPTKSKTIPSHVYICSNDGKTIFYGVFVNFDERPSVEWLMCLAPK